MLLDMTHIKGFIKHVRSNSLAMDSFWTLLGSGVGKGLSLLAGVFVARFLGSELYGEYGVIRTTLIYIAIVSTFGFGYTATKFVAEANSDNLAKLRSLVDKILIITLIFSSLLSIVFTLFADQIAVFLKAVDLSGLLRRYSFLIILNAMVSTQIAIISGFKNFKSASIVNIWSGVIVFVGSIIFTYCWGIDGALLALSASFVVQFVLNRRIIRKKLNPLKEESISLKWNEIFPLVKFSIPIALQESLYTVVHWATTWLLIKYSDYTQVGLSSAGALWQSMVIFIPAMLKNVMFSYLTTSKDNSHLTRQLVIFNLASSIVPVVFVILFSNLIQTIYGASFYGIKTIVIVCVISSIFISVSEVYCYKLISKSKPWLVFISRLIRDIFILGITLIAFTFVTTNQALILSIISLFANILYLILVFFISKNIIFKSLRSN